MVRYLILTLCLSLLVGCASRDSGNTGSTSQGQASWHGAQHQGKATASGEPPIASYRLVVAYGLPI